MKTVLHPITHPATHPVQAYPAHDRAAPEGGAMTGVDCSVCAGDISNHAQAGVTPTYSQPQGRGYKTPRICLMLAICLVRTIWADWPAIYQ